MKKTSITLFALIGMFFIGSSFTTVESSYLPWKKLGAKKVSFQLDKDIIHLGKNDGAFRKLKIVVSGGNVNMHKMTVEYGNGRKDNIPLSHTFSKGSDSRIIDLEGGKRVIKDITFWYDTKNFSKKRATVHVYGRK